MINYIKKKHMFDGEYHSKIRSFFVSQKLDKSYKLPLLDG